ncbi:MAG: hypothetical protein RLO50_06220 [Azospirillaceae bacterium]
MAGRVLILHHDPEPAEGRIAGALREQGHEVALQDVRRAAEAQPGDIVFNRVYASVGNRDWRAVALALAWMRRAERRGAMCINPAAACLADYAKLVAARRMARAGVPAPATRLWPGRLDDATGTFLEGVGWPVIVKPDLGGRGHRVTLVEGPLDLIRTIAALDRQTPAGARRRYVLQAFVPTEMAYDLRVGVVAGEVRYAYGRSFVPGAAGGRCWLASVSRGSALLDDVALPDEAGAAARAASAAIGAVVNEVDIVLGPAGPMVIENNLTPNFIDTPADQVRLRALIEPLAGATGDAAVPRLSLARARA